MTTIPQHKLKMQQEIQCYIQKHASYYASGFKVIVPLHSVGLPTLT